MQRRSKKQSKSVYVTARIERSERRGNPAARQAGTGLLRSEAGLELTTFFLIFNL